MKISSRKKIILSLLSSLLLVSFGSALFAYNLVFKNPTFVFSLQKDHPGIFTLAKKTFKLTDILFIGAIFQKDEVPTLSLLIDKDKLLEMKSILPEKDKKTAAVFWEDEEMKVRVKYRGASKMHWAFPKKSIRFYLQDEAHVMGTEVFNLIIPEDRGYLYEHYSNHVAEKLGLPTLKSDYVKLELNGQAQGLYYFLEEPSKAFLERNGLNSDGNLYKNENHDQFADTVFQNPGYWKKYEASPHASEDDYSDLEALLENVNTGQPAEWIIDIDNFLAYNAHAILMNSNHQNSNSNIVTYFDPSKGKFIFIPWDTVPASFDPLLIKGMELVPHILTDPEVMFRRNQLLWEYVNSEEQLKDDLAFMDDNYKRIKAAMYKDRNKEVPNLTFRKWWKQHKKDIEKRYQSLRNRLSKSEAHVNLEWQDQHTLNMKIRSMGFSSVAISQELVNHDLAGENLRIYQDSNANGMWDETDEELTGVVNLGSQRVYGDHDYSVTTIEAKEYQFFVRWPQGSFDILTLDQAWDFDLSNAITGEKAATTLTFTDRRTFSDMNALSRSKTQFLAKYPYFKDGGNELILGPGQIQILENVIVPQHLSVRIQAGTQLKMAPGVSFVSRSKVNATGSAQEPIRIHAQNPSQAWGVFAVNGEGANGSQFTYVDVQGGSEATINGTFYSGMLSAHFAEANVENSYFAHSKGDDALNIKNAKTRLISNTFESPEFDGIDLDFIEEGYIFHNQFSAVGNDAIDIGGGSPIIAWNTVHSCGDKGISVGEQANPLIYEVQVSNCATGVAAKDNSNPIIVNSRFNQNSVGVAGYIKKPLFGPSHSFLFDVKLESNDLDISLDELSTIQVTDTVYNESKVDQKGNITIAEEEKPSSDIPRINQFLRNPDESQAQ